MEKKLKDMLGKKPEELEGETLKLFEAIMKIADERDELRVRNKELEKNNERLETKVKRYEKYLENKDKRFEEALEYEFQERERDYIPKSKVREKDRRIKQRRTRSTKQYK